MNKPKEFSLTNYKQTLFRLGNLLRQLRDFAERLNLQEIIDSIDDALNRVEESTFSIAVVGEFKRGKSTFINALLGKEILPSDILPTTATLNRVTYGLKPFVKIQFKDASEEIIALEDLSNYVTKLTPESEAIAATIQEAIVHYPVSYCQNNVDIIDTPGLSDDEAMTETTLSVLSKVDVAILVIMALSPLSESERAFLENHLLNEDLSRILFVVTGIDRCNSTEDVEKIVTSIENRIQSYILNGVEQQYEKESEQYKARVEKVIRPKVFPVSAYQALKAKQNHNLELMKTSRFNEFELALENFLAEERGVVFLQFTINRIISLSEKISKITTKSSNDLEQKYLDIKADYETKILQLNTQQQVEVNNRQQSQQKINMIIDQVKSFCDQIEAEIKHSANQSIDLALITSHDFNQSVAFNRMSKLDKEITEKIVICSRRLAGKLQLELQQNLSALPSELKPSEKNIQKCIKTIGMQFVTLSNVFRTVLKKKSLAMQTSKQIKGFGVWLGNTLGNDKNNSVESFKDNYKNAIASEISQQLRLNTTIIAIETEIKELLKYSKQRINHSENEAKIQNNDLAELQVQFAREQAQINVKKQELERMNDRTQAILNDANDFSTQLAQLTIS